MSHFSDLLDVLPGNWTKANVGNYCDVQLGKMLQSEPSSEDDELKPYLRAINIGKNGVDHSHELSMWIKRSELQKFRLNNGDVLVSEGGDAGRVAMFHADGEYFFQNAINRVRPLLESRMLPKYIYYWLSTLKSSGYVEMVCNVATIPHYTAEKLKASPLAFPSLQAQERIARFLDEKTARIDSLIEKKQALLERLAEKRQALITRAVTKGMNPDVPLKPSGVDWLGDIPRHWNLKRLRFLCDGGTLNGLYKPKDQHSADGVPFVQMGEAFRGEIFDGDTKDRVLCSEFEVEKWGLKPGDFLIARRSLVFEGSGKSVMIGAVDEDHVFESSMIRIRLVSPQTFSGFLSHYFRSSVCRAFVLSITKQVTISGIDSQQLKEVLIPVPPDAEAEKISETCQQIRSDIEATEKSVANSIALLSEHRSALITAAVTGQLADLNG